MSFNIRLLKWLYTLGFTLCVPVILLRLLWKSRKLPGYRERLLERFGFFKKPSGVTGGLWLHAVSLGESIAAIPIIRAFQKQFPSVPVTVTTMTPTGSANVQKTFGDQVFHVYCPYDLSWSVNQFLKRIRPKLCVIMETEIWPNYLWSCKKNKIPVIIANGRLSPHSLQGYKRIQGIMKHILNWVTTVAAQSKMDGERFLALGLEPSRLVVTGNVKFDAKLDEEKIKKEALILRENFGQARSVWIAASTHEGEEEPVLAAFSAIKKQFPDALLLLVPRHPERFKTVAEKVQQHGYSMVSRSSKVAVKEDTAVFLGDTMGELNLFYAASDVAFVGGSLMPIGGHNALEPAALGIPIIMGPHVNNCVDTTKLLLNAGALVQVQDSQSLARAVMHWLNIPAERRSAGEKGRQVLAENRGAVDKIGSLMFSFFETKH